MGIKRTNPFTDWEEVVEQIRFAARITSLTCSTIYLSFMIGKGLPGIFELGQITELSYIVFSAGVFLGLGAAVISFWHELMGAVLFLAVANIITYAIWICHTGAHAGIVMVALPYFLFGIAYLCLAKVSQRFLNG